MRVYIEHHTSNGEPSLINFHIATQAFLQFGFHIIETEKAEHIPVDDRDCVAVGSIAYIKAALKHLGKSVPPDISYPPELHAYLGRKIWSSTVDEISNDPSGWNVFIKPKDDLKKFTGNIIRSVSDLRSMGDQFYNTPVWVSEPVTFVREWRVFVRYGKIMDIRPYKGDYHFQYDVSVIEKAISDFTAAPASFAIDFGVTNDGRTLLIEVNEGFSVGAYGLFYTDYARFLSTRWAQLTGYEDLCHF